MPVKPDSGNQTQSQAPCPEDQESREEGLVWPPDHADHAKPGLRKWISTQTLQTERVINSTALKEPNWVCLQDHA